MNVRELTNKEYAFFFPSRNYSGKIKPELEMTADIWVNFNPDYRPFVYRFYNCGTNYLRILRYNPYTDMWIELNDDAVDELINRSLLWKVFVLLNNGDTNENS